MIRWFDKVPCSTNVQDVSSNAAAESRLYVCVGILVSSYVFIGGAARNIGFGGLKCWLTWDITES